MAMISLTAEEARVLGCLMEKAVTTPDNYPLSVNALDHRVQPVDEPRPDRRSTSESTVERALDSLREKELTRRVKATGQRVVKHRHVVGGGARSSIAPEFDAARRAAAARARRRRGS